MDFEIGILFTIGCLFSFSKSQSRYQVYYSAPGQEYRRIYTLSESQRPEFFKAGHTSFLPYSFSRNAFWYQNQHSKSYDFQKYKALPINTSRYILVYQKSYPIQYGGPVEYNKSHLKNFNINYPNNNEISYIKNKGFKSYNSAIYFEEYPHIRSLLKHQKTRQDNKLPPLKLKSLRINSLFYRI